MEIKFEKVNLLNGFQTQTSAESPETMSVYVCWPVTMQWLVSKWRVLHDQSMRDISIILLNKVKSTSEQAIT